ncbi:hypothetical protein TIFTF001_040426 [Ficus carica]|uniref:Uncharacterized protein n=1 Tax=Ficus carica TaxID=3494 RepID=A0AA88CNC6_FICCA|nr:hypothetical protein TIFTF001_040426 [Ficus carica]
MIETRISLHIIKQVSRVVPTYHEGGFWFGPWFELDRAGRLNHSMAIRHDTYTHVHDTQATYRTSLMQDYGVMSLQTMKFGLDTITYKDKDMNLVPLPNPGRIEEDCEASLAFWDMEPPNT